MLKPLKPRPIACNISTFDIETSSKGKLLDIGFQHEFEYQTFKTWLSFLQYLANYAGDEKITVCWAHNGGKFDTVALLCEIYRNKTIYDQLITNYHATLSNGAILELDIEFKNGEHTKFRDSFRLFPMSLDKLLKSFDLGGKISIPDDYKSRMEDYKKEHRKEYYKYLQQDCFGLSQALKKFRLTVNDIANVGDLPLSLGSLAMKIFRTEFLTEDLFIPTGAAATFADDSFSGGRTEYFGNGIKNSEGIYEHCNYYDVNSMYPAEMLNGYFPSGQPSLCKELIYIGENEDILCPGCYHIIFQQTGGHIPLLRGRVNGKKTKEHVWVGEGTYTSDEVLYLQNIGAKIKIISGWVYPKSKQLFKPFIESLYNLRMESRKNGNAAMDLTCKLILNNLYGKFAQREEGEELQFLPMDEIKKRIEDIENGKDQQPLSVSLLDDANHDEITCGDAYACVIKKRAMVAHRHVLIGALITARSRIKITAMAEKYHDQAIYCDTDSFITQAEIDEDYISHSELGKWKPEHLDESFEFFGRKQYAHGDEIKQKGVKIKEREKFLADVKTEMGYLAKYRAPAGIKQALKKQIDDPNFFADFYRTIKTDLSSAEKNLLK